MSLKNPVTSPGIDPGTVRLVAQCLNHYSTPGPDNDRSKTEMSVDKRAPGLVFPNKSHTGHSGAKG